VAGRGVFDAVKKKKRGFFWGAGKREGHPQREKPRKSEKAKQARVWGDFFGKGTGPLAIIHGEAFWGPTPCRENAVNSPVSRAALAVPALYFPCKSAMLIFHSPFLDRATHRAALTQSPILE
jgi:hypothetical protein